MSSLFILLKELKYTSWLAWIGSPLLQIYLQSSLPCIVHADCCDPKMTRFLCFSSLFVVFHFSSCVRQPRFGIAYILVFFWSPQGAVPQGKCPAHLPLSSAPLRALLHLSYWCGELRLQVQSCTTHFLTADNCKELSGVNGGTLIMQEWYR